MLSSKSRVLLYIKNNPASAKGHNILNWFFSGGIATAGAKTSTPLEHLLGTAGQKKNVHRYRWVASALLDRYHPFSTKEWPLRFGMIRNKTEHSWQLKSFSSSSQVEKTASLRAAPPPPPAGRSVALRRVSVTHQTVSEFAVPPQFSLHEDLWHALSGTLLSFSLRRGRTGPNEKHEIIDIFSPCACQWRQKSTEFGGLYWQMPSGSYLEINKETNKKSFTWRGEAAMSSAVTYISVGVFQAFIISHLGGKTK